MGDRSGSVVVSVVVRLDQAVAVVLGSCCTTLVGNEELRLAVPAFRPVERVVLTVGHDEVFHIDGASEELHTVVRATVYLNVVDGRAVAHTIECQSVGFRLFRECIAGTLQTDVAHRTRIVVVICRAASRAVGVAADFRFRAGTLVGMCLSTDVYPTPAVASQRSTFGRVVLHGHHDGAVGSALCIDFAIHGDHDIVGSIVVVLSLDGHARFDFEQTAGLHQVFTGELEGVAFFEDDGLSVLDTARQCSAVLHLHGGCVASAGVLAVVIAVAACSGAETHTHQGCHGPYVYFHSKNIQFHKHCSWLVYKLVSF